MKKLYTLLPALALALSCSATVDFNMSASRSVLPDTDFPVCERVIAGDYTVSATPGISAQLQSKVSGRLKADEQLTWNSIGKGKFTDDFFTVLQGFKIETWEVEIYEAAEQPGLYAIENPYAVAGNPYADLGATQTGAWLIDARDPNKVNMSMYNPGIDLSSSSLGIVLVGGWPEFLKLAGQEANITDDMYGKLVDGIIEFPQCVFYLSGYNGGTGFNRTGCKLSLPGADTYTANLMMDQCAAGNKTIISANFTGNVKETKFFLAEGRFPATAENFKVVATNGTATGGRLSFRLNLDGSVYTKNQILTVFIVGLNSKGDVVCSDFGYFDVIVDDAANWKTIGTGQLTDNIISGFYNNIAQQTLNVTVQENVNTPGYYRVVNPFAELAVAPNENEHAADHNHYMYVHAEDHFKVYIEDSPMGIDLGYGVIRVNSLAGSAIANGKTPEAGSYGSMRNNAITFPAQKLTIGEYEGHDLKFYYTNKNGAFKLVVPKSDGIADIDADNADAPAVYYNMQGQRVDNPVAGQLLLKRSGAKVTKELIR